MLELDGVTVTYEGVRLLDELDLVVATGETVAVLGPSGVGKSTLLRVVAGLVALEGGRVCFDGEDLATVPVHKRGFALVFQDGQLFEHQTVAGNIGYALRLRRMPKRDITVRVDEMLELVDLQGYGDRKPATLSGGERQRVALARALVSQPRLLLLDEPLSALDRDLRERLAADLREILVRRRTTALFVTHDEAEAARVADRVARLRQGKIAVTT